MNLLKWIYNIKLYRFNFFNKFYLYLIIFHCVLKLKMAETPIWSDGYTVLSSIKCW